MPYLLAKLSESGQAQFSTRDALRLVQNQAWISGSDSKASDLVREVLQELCKSGEVRKERNKGKSEVWELHPQLVGQKMSD
jgi:hypothetical protein